MLEIYLDSTDVAGIKNLCPALPLAGVTTNPSIMAASGVGLYDLLTALTEVIGPHGRYHVQVVNNTVEGIVAEARKLLELPFDIIVKIPAHTAGLSAIKQLKKDNIPLLATAIYTVQQGMMAALHGADYLAPYLNRIDNQGSDGVGVVADLQGMIDRYQLPGKLLVASFKNVNQVLQVLKLGVGAVTLPLDIAQQILTTPATDTAVEKFSLDWQATFANKLSFES
ncbi:transaldolase family protein [Methylomonas albis]|uniref:Fructose-6-phosphate aldolase n=1 Tax=Methylomonas albis TaxID=1854563 RepID=A0ABR9D392_9GAMM|nr:transaldolase family protein [Methylomonas albis]MBD9357276.1 fructose-6-phosphate aldolase [Methylomonas albis]